MRPNGVGPELQQISEIWRAMSEFGVDRADFLGYWRNADIAQTSSPTIRVSIYSRTEKGLLMVVSNLGSANDPAASVQLDLKGLHLDGKAIEVTDALTGEKIPIEAGKITLALQKLRMRLLRVR